MTFCSSEETSVSFESKGHNMPLTIQQCYLLFLGEIPFCKQGLLTAMSTLHKWAIHSRELNSFLWPYSQRCTCGFDILGRFKEKQLFEVNNRIWKMNKMKSIKQCFLSKTLPPCFTPSSPRTLHLIKLRPKSNINCFPGTH